MAALLGSLSISFFSVVSGKSGSVESGASAEQI